MSKTDDPRGTKAAKDFVEKVADIKDSDVYGRPYINLSKLRNQARRIRVKFRKKK